MKIIENGESLTKVNTGLAYSFDAMVAEIAPKLFFSIGYLFQTEKKKIFQRTIVFEKGQKSGEIAGGNFGLQTSCSLAIEPKDKADMEINFVPDNQTAELEKFEGEIDKLERERLWFSFDSPSPQPSQTKRQTNCFPGRNHGF